MLNYNLYLTYYAFARAAEFKAERLSFMLFHTSTGNYYHAHQGTCDRFSFNFMQLTECQFSLYIFLHRKILYYRRRPQNRKSNIMYANCNISQMWNNSSIFLYMYDLVVSHIIPWLLTTPQKKHSLAGFMCKQFPCGYVYIIKYDGILILDPLPRHTCIWLLWWVLCLRVDLVITQILLWDSIIMSKHTSVMS